MPSSGHPNPGDRNRRVFAVVRTALVQVLVLLAVAVAIIRYLDWSSDANWAEFLANSQTSALASHHQTPVQTVNSPSASRRGD